LETKKQALISVYDKRAVTELAAFLTESGWDILSTGGTSRYLQEHRVPVTDVQTITGFPECLDGRVKTLHPAIHAGLLARRDSPAHLETLRQQGLSPIDLVCVNLYPFFQKVQENLSLEETVEFIDIGGPTMLRSAAKNYHDVIVLTDPDDYEDTIAALRTGTVDQVLRKRLAAKVFDLTAAYDAAIARYLLDEQYPRFWPLSLSKAQALRYGENGHQSAALYFNTDEQGALSSMEQLAGKELSYNNIRDLDLAWKAVCAFGLGAEPAIGAGGSLPDAVDKVCCVAVKHNTPCGVALGGTLLEAYEKAYSCDPVSIFGGIVACNAVFDLAVAQKMGDLFLEIIVAPDFTPEALELLKRKKNLRIMKAPCAPRQRVECSSVDGGLLVQETDRKLLEKWDMVTRRAPDPGDIADMLFGLRVVTYVKSNAIVVVKGLAALGIGGGETNRISATELALDRSKAAIAALAKSDGSPARVLASDAFFPFPDVVEAAAAGGITSIIQPGGSQNDQASIDACNRLGIAMVFTGTRHFKH
jgi:phosphoribosylaminoimidazolecarboxamide formyltransferase/IMP cyclohydrolase